MASKGTTMAIMYKVSDANGGFKQLALYADGLRII